jgi:hypothetical protein
LRGLHRVDSANEESFYPSANSLPVRPRLPLLPLPPVLPVQPS